MGQPENAARLTREGRTPSQLCVDLTNKPKPLNMNSVLSYLSRAIGDGQIRWSDVFFNMYDQGGHRIEQFLEEHPDAGFSDMLGHIGGPDQHLTWDDYPIYRRLRHYGVAWGDLYAVLAQLERTLHGRIRAALKEQFGSEDDQWWHKGVPQDIREQCEQRRSGSREEPLLPPYYYTTFRNLIDIILHSWPVFEPVLPASAASNRGDLIDGLYRVSRIRNRVMHPVRSAPPSKDELEFLRNIRDQLAGSKWNLSGS